MSILIKKMEMPKGCWACPFAVGKLYECLVTVDERTEYDDLYCSECGARSADNFFFFFPHCGAKMEGAAE